MSSVIGSAKRQVDSLQGTFNQMTGTYLPNIRNARQMLVGLQRFFFTDLAGFVARLGRTQMQSVQSSQGVAGLIVYILRLTDDIVSSVGSICQPPLCSSFSTNFAGEYQNASFMNIVRTLDNAKMVAYGPWPFLYAMAASFDTSMTAQVRVSDDERRCRFEVVRRLIPRLQIKARFTRMRVVQRTLVMPSASRTCV